jgi:hypothetical protein
MSPKQKAQKPKVKPQKAKAKAPSPPFSGSFINSRKQGEAEALREGCDIVTRETCVPASLNVNLENTAVWFRTRDVPISAYRKKAINHISPCMYLVLIGFNPPPHNRIQNQLTKISIVSKHQQ